MFMEVKSYENINVMFTGTSFMMARTERNNRSTDKRRKQVKECMKRLRENIKSDPVRYEEAKRKERERYHARKASGKIKAVSDMSEREKRATRRKWKERSKRYYQRKKESIREHNFLDDYTPPESPVQELLQRAPEEPNIHDDTPKTTRTTSTNSRSRVASGERIRRKNKHELKTRIEYLERKLKEADKRAEKYKKRNLRLKKTIKKISPQTSVTNMVSGLNVGQTVRKKLLFGEVLSSQLRENFKKQKGSLQKRKFVQHITGPLIKKYGFTKYMASLSSHNILFGKGKFGKDRMQNKILQTQQCVTSFLLKDENSRVCPGKKDTITFHKQKKQKRYLNDTLKNIYEKFKKSYPTLKISYPTFCKMRPFWVLQPNVSARNTCLCLMHTNMALVISRLHSLKIIQEKTPEEVIQSLTCTDKPSIENCLVKKCEQCQNKTIKILQYDSNEESYYEKWITKKQVLTIRGKEKICQKTVKEKIFCLKADILIIFQQNLNKFSMHVRNIIHQYNVLDNIKKNLATREILIHADFSENYNCKYNEEVQSAHFGGSKPQISLHTVVIYYKHPENGNSVPLSICTLSDNLRHDPSAICAHLQLAIDEIRKIVPCIENVHFLSDGPSTQYRNKKMFFLMANYLANYMEVDRLCWHYSESGHGKGAPDGIGGLVKREADRLVAMGRDIPDFHSLVQALRDSTKVKIIPIDSARIEEIDCILPQTLSAFKGTMKIHEVCWSKNCRTLLRARQLSCIDCREDQDCGHYGLGNIQLQVVEGEHILLFQVQH